jgi:hypothetical protein
LARVGVQSLLAVSSAVRWLDYGMNICSGQEAQLLGIVEQFCKLARLKEIFCRSWLVALVNAGALEGFPR